jgi:serine hydrolase
MRRASLPDGRQALGRPLRIPYNISNRSNSAIKITMKRQVVIIGGGSTYDSYEDYLKNLKEVELDIDRLMQRGWKDSFAQKLGKEFVVMQPKMPNPNNAHYTEWVMWFRKIIPFIKPGVVFVGHSLGGIFLAKYLATHTFPRRIKATILIAAPFHDTSMDESLGDFLLPKSLKKFAAQGGQIFLYQSDDDRIVPAEHAAHYQQALPNAVMRMFQRKGHFNQETFPELIREIRAL